MGLVKPPMKQTKSIHNLRFRAVNRDIFEAIRSGKKRVETRAATHKYNNVKAGDKIRLVCGKSSFQKSAKKVRVFKTIELLLQIYPVKDINPNISSKEELMKMYYSFPGYRQKIEQYGILAIELG